MDASFGFQIPIRHIAFNQERDRFDAGFFAFLIIQDLDFPAALFSKTDGSRIVFSFSLAGVTNIFWIPWDGSGPVERLTTSKQIQVTASMSPAGRLLAFVELSPVVNYDIYYLRIDSRQASPIISTSYVDGWPEFSPDGRWLAYGSNESGRLEVYVTPVPGPGRRIPISVEGGREPLWARSGRELFYWSLDSKKLMAVDTVLQAEFRAGAPRVLFEFQGLATTPSRVYDVSPDGQRFLIPGPLAIKPVEVTQLNLVLNWFEELKRLAPGGKTR